MYSSTGFLYFLDSKTKRNDGFTLIELMIVIAIAGIVLTIGIPSFSSIIKDNRQITLRNEFTSYFHFAKSVAVTQGESVTLCSRNSEGTNCNDSGSWDDGWIVFVDINGDGDKDSEDTILKIQQAINDDINITTSPASAKVTINGRGFITAQSTFTFCDSRGANYANAKTLSKTGRMNLSTASLTCS